VPRGTQREAGPRTDSRSYGGNRQREDSGARPVAPRDFSRSDGFRGSDRSGSLGSRYDGNVRRGGGVYRGYSGSYNRGYSNRSFNRGYYNRGYYNRGYYNRGYSYGSRRGYRSYAPIRFYRPYYSFRPRLSLGFGLWVGYPVPYYDPFYYPDYSYSYPYPATTYPVYPQSAYPSSPYPQTRSPQAAPDSFDDDALDDSSIDVQPSQSNTGGLSFDITPGQAEVIVDGKPVGTVDQFTPTSQPLGLPAGRHRVEVRAAGYKTITFEVNIVAGQVIPYQGNLER